jgi:hypothetical protein
MRVHGQEAHQPALHKRPGRRQDQHPAPALRESNHRIDNLLNALEESGWSREIEIRPAEWRAEKTRGEAELNQVEALRERGKVELSDEVLDYLSKHLTEQLRSSDPANARGVLQRYVKRIDVHKRRVVIKYAPPLVEMLSSQLHGYRLCPRGVTLQCHVMGAAY